MVVFELTLCKNIVQKMQNRKKNSVNVKIAIDISPGNCYYNHNKYFKCTKCWT